MHKTFQDSPWKAQYSHGRLPVLPLQELEFQSQENYFCLNIHGQPAQPCALSINAAASLAFSSPESCTLILFPLQPRPCPQLQEAASLPCLKSPIRLPKPLFLLS